MAKKTPPEVNGHIVPLDVPEDVRLASLRAENERLKAEVKRVREERCLDALEAVLVAHNCALTALADGRFQVKVRE